MLRRYLQPALEPCLNNGEVMKGRSPFKTYPSPLSYEGEKYREESKRGATVTAGDKPLNYAYREF